MRSRRSVATVGLLATTAICLLSSASAYALELPYFNILENSPRTLTGGEVTLESANFLVPVKCTSLTGNVYWTSEHEATSSIALKGCSAGGFKGTCATAGAAPGEITVTNGAPVRLALLSKVNHEAALVLNYHKSGEVATFAKFTCEEGNYTARGSLVAKLTPVGITTSTHQVILKSSAIKQEFTKYQIEGKTLEEVTAKFYIGFGSEPNSAGAVNAGIVNFLGQPVELVA